MPNALDLTGQRFGRLVVLRPGARNVSPGGQSRTTWETACDCGRTKTVRTGKLRTGRATSCGCYQAEVRSLNGRRSRRAVAGYYAAHSRVRRANGPAERMACVDCGAAATQWSYNHDDPDELTEGLGRKGGPVYVVPYSLSEGHYSPRCYSCHIKFDRSHVRRNGVAS